MNYKSKILPEAKEDMRLAVEWYNEQRTNLGRQFVKRVRERIAFLKKNPFSCQVRYLDVHTALIKQFPYMLHYTINKEKKEIIVLTVLHTSRNPKIWIGKRELIG